jgi:hypothetical protein
MNMSGGPVEVLETLFAIYMNCHRLPLSRAGRINSYKLFRSDFKVLKDFVLMFQK